MSRHRRRRLTRWELAFLIFFVIVLLAFLAAVIFAPPTEHWYLDIPS